MILVIAGSYAQAKYWMHAYGFSPMEWRYVSDASNALGHWKPIVWFVGLYWNSSVKAEDLRYLEVHDAVFVYPDEVVPEELPFADV